MNDPFDGLVSGGAAQALMAGAGMFSEAQQRNDALEEQRAARSQGMLQFISQQNALQQQSQQQDRQFRLAYDQGERQAAAQREESAFSRLSAALDAHLKAVEIESRDRQQAFENSLRAQQADVQARMQGFQLRQFERMEKGQDLMAQIDVLSTNMALDPANLETHIDSLASLMKDSEAVQGMKLTPEGAETIKRMQGVIQAYNSGYVTKVPKLSAGFVPGDNFTPDQLREKIQSADFTKESLDADTLQSIGYYAQHAAGLLGEKDEALVDEAVRTLFGDDANPNDITPKQRAMAQIVAARGRGSSGVDALAGRLNDEVAKARFETLYDAGLLTPITNKDQIMQLAAHEQAKSMQLGEMQAMTKGMFLTSNDPTIREAREDLLSGWEEARNDILSGGNPLAKAALGGAYSWSSVRDGVRNQIKLASNSKSRTAMDWFDTLTGIPSSLDTLSDIANGRWGEVDRYKVGNLALTAATLVPGLGYITGGVRTARALRAAQAGTRLARAGYATERAAALAAKAAAAGTSASYSLKGAITARKALTAAKALEATKVAARAGAYGPSALRTGAWALPAKAAVARGGFELVSGGHKFRELGQAEDRVGEQVRMINGMQGRASMEAINQLGMALDDYVATAGKYFPDGQVPAAIQQKMLNVRNLVPRHVWRAIEKSHRAQTSPYGEGSGDAMSRLYAMFGQQSPMSVGAPAGIYGAAAVPGTAMAIGGGAGIPGFSADAAE